MKTRIFYDEKDRSTKIELLEDVVIHGFSIPKGFISDGGSIPRLFWNICSPLEYPYLPEFLLHDYLYSVHVTSRKKADKILLDGLKDAGMPLVRRRLIYRAVRLFGGGHW